MVMSILISISVEKYLLLIFDINGFCFLQQKMKTGEKGTIDPVTIIITGEVVAEVDTAAEEEAVEVYRAVVFVKDTTTWDIQGTILR